MVKKITWLIALLLILNLVILPATAQDGGDGEGEGTETPPPPQAGSLADTLVSISETGDEFARFVEALEETGLDLTLHTGGPFTVFAPTDAAIDTYLAAQGMTPTDFFANPQLVTQILQYHVLPGRFLSREIINYDRGAMATILPGTAVDITMLVDALYINELRVIGTDIPATNGVIYTIDTILLPPESGLVITEPPAEEDDSETPDEDTEETVEAPQPLFTLNLMRERENLDAFITAIELSEAMTGLVNGDGPFTIFAPTNEGFGNALEELGISGNDLINDTNRLNETLFYHVVPIKLTPENLADLDGINIGTTAQGVAVRVNVVDGRTYVNRGQVDENFAASNGNIVVVDFLLLETDSLLTRQAIEILNEAEAASEEAVEDDSADEGDVEDEEAEPSDSGDEETTDESQSDEETTDDGESDNADGDEGSSDEFETSE